MTLRQTTEPGATTAPGSARARLTRFAAALSSPSSERRWLLWPPLAFFAVMLGIPMVALVVTALSGEGNAFAEIFQLNVFVSALIRTFVLALIVTAVTVVFGLIYSVGLAVAPSWLKWILLAWLFLSLWTSVMVRSFGWMLIELPLGALHWFLSLIGLSEVKIELYQTTVGMYPAMIAVMLPFAVLPVVAAIESLDREQLRAAVVYGAGPLLAIRTVVLPVVRPALISGGVLVFVMSLGFYVTPLLLGGPSNMTISGLINTQLNTANRPDLAAAMSIVLVAATMLIYLVADRLFKVSERWG
ncbi:MAG: ABC transporter permease [Herbiconiux sp.]|uniref:ABC transporter permease n=1 Tax=Herbiconiux sp. TaxID=1871186 RepID=UPI0012280C60|nr:ABC transporter permease [Herbiconiux sp.]TAJ48087.1 MAG: ABC transporter permease [Herbiconiux sp.]